MWGAAAGALLAFVVITATRAEPAADAGLDALLGKALFERQWVAAPASTDAADGLGPLFNAKSCVACHKDGGGARLDSNGTLRGAVVRVTDGMGETHPHFGRQLQDQALVGHDAEGKMQWAGDKLRPVLSDGTLPLFEVRLSPSLKVSAMIAAVDDKAITELADPSDADADGISGRARLLVDGSIGRFGLKSTHATLESQIADAFAFDLGLSSPHYPLPAGDCTVAQPVCLGAPTGESAAMGGHEISNDMIGLVASYLHSLKPRQTAETDAGQIVFAQAQCTSCHLPTMAGKNGPVRLYSDLLLHDMGPESEGVVRDGNVAVTEWRTAPLVDLFVKDAARRYMHDGKAGSIEAAIMAHGGEAERARNAYHSLPREQKNALVQFLETL